jgi:hypothetical protein
MTATLAAALLLQSVAIMLLRQRLGRAWLRRPVPLLALASAVYQGLPALLLAFPSVAAQDPYRIGIQPRFTADATLLTSTEMLALVIAYLLTQPQRVMASASEDDRQRAVKVLDWRLLIAACVPLAVLTYEGRGYNGGLTTGAGAPLLTDLASSSFTILVVVTAFSIALRSRPKWFLLIMLGQSGALALAGERTPIITDAVALALMLARAGVRPSVRQVSAAVALTILAILAITSARAQDGRLVYETGRSVGARAASLGGGVVSLAGGPTQQGSPGLIAQAAGRLDGDALTGAILQAQSLGQPRLSPAGVPESLLLNVPSALWPSKLAHGGALNPAATEISDFGLPSINFLPTLPGLYAGFLSPPWLLIFMTLLGAVSGWAERWLLRECTPGRLVLLAGAVTAALRYEQGLPGMLLALRAALVIAMAVKVVEVVRGRLSRRHHSLPLQQPTLEATLGGIIR